MGQLGRYNKVTKPIRDGFPKKLLGKLPSAQNLTRHLVEVLYNASEVLMKNEPNPIGTVLAWPVDYCTMCI